MHKKAYELNFHSCTSHFTSFFQSPQRSILALHFSGPVVRVQDLFSSSGRLCRSLPQFWFWLQFSLLPASFLPTAKCSVSEAVPRPYFQGLTYHGFYYSRFPHQQLWSSFAHLISLLFLYFLCSTTLQETEISASPYSPVFLQVSFL